MDDKQKAGEYGQQRDPNNAEQTHGVGKIGLSRGKGIVQALVQLCGEARHRPHDFFNFVIVCLAEHQRFGTGLVWRALHCKGSLPVRKQPAHGVHGLGFQNNELVGQLARLAQQGKLAVGEPGFAHELLERHGLAGGNGAVGGTRFAAFADFHDFRIGGGKTLVTGDGKRAHRGREIAGACLKFRSKKKRNAPRCLGGIRGCLVVVKLIDLKAHQPACKGEHKACACNNFFQCHEKLLYAPPEYAACMRRTGIRYAQTDNPCCAVGKNRFRDVAPYLRPLPCTLRLPEKSAFAGKGIGLCLIFQASPENFFRSGRVPLRATPPIRCTTAKKRPQGSRSRRKARAKITSWRAARTAEFPAGAAAQGAW